MHLGNPTAMYGAERWILALVRNLLGDTVHNTIGVIVDDPETREVELCTYASNYGIDTVQFRSMGKLSWSAISQIRKYVNENDIDVVHTHGYKTDLIGLLAVARTNCRIVSTPHGWSTDAGWKLRLYELLDRIAFYFMSAVAPLSADLYKGLDKWPFLRRRMVLIRNGVDLDEIDSVGDTPPDLIPPETPGGYTVGYIGQLINRKGLDTLIRAFAGAEIEGKKLWLVGDGSQRGELEALADSLGESDNIHFLGFREDRIRILRKFDVFVLPSWLEGVPRCLLEAMAVGIPVIASDIPGCTDLVRNGSTGQLFGPGDADGLRRALEKMHDDDDLASQIGANGRSFVRREFSAETMARHYVTLYRKLVDSPAPGVPSVAD